MPTDRPVSGATIDSEWGQDVHDRVHAPKGCRVHGDALSLSTSSSLVTLHLTTADDDPGGWLDAANYRIECPTGAGGLYVVTARINSVDGDIGDKVRAYMLLNGTAIAGDSTDSYEGANQPFTITAMPVLSAGDRIIIRAGKVGSGANPSVSVLSLVAARIGDELGA